MPKTSTVSFVSALVACWALLAQHGQGQDPTESHPDQALLDAYVRRVVASSPGGVLPEYLSADFFLIDTLLGNLDAVPGLTPGGWCGHSMDGFVVCDGDMPLVEFTGATLTSSCFVQSVPLESYIAAWEAASRELGGSTIARYVVFTKMDENPPRAYAFRVSELGPYIASTTFCPAAPNSVGSGALISAGGSTSRLANDLVLSAAPVPDQPGLFFLSHTAIQQQPFGSGYLCLGGPHFRLPMELGQNGVLSHAVDFTDPNSVASRLPVGSHWYVQAWYRDPVDGGAGFNLSQGLGLFICP